MGTQKLLLPYKEKAIVDTVASNAFASELAGVFVVGSPEISGHLQVFASKTNTKVVINHKNDKGLSSSMKLGLQSIPQHVNAVVFLLGDQPLVTETTINKMIVYFQQLKEPRILQAAYFERKGHPVLFHRDFFDSLMEVTGDEGGRSVLKKFSSSIETIEMGIKFPYDIDTKEDYRRLLREEAVY